MDIILTSIVTWFNDHGLRIILIILGATLIDLLVDRFARSAIHSFISRTHTDRDEYEIEQRVATLHDVFSKTTSAITVIVIGMLILSEFGVNVSTIFASAGIVGLAIGFGSQNLVRDIVTGFFILIEDQYDKGDKVTVAGVTGIVQEVNLRRTIVRDANGAEHHIPNGEIKITANHTKDWATMNVTIPVATSENVDEVMKVLKDVADTFKNAHPKSISSAPKILGIEEWTPSSLTVLVSAKTRPGKQWELARDFRMRVKKKLEQR